MSFRKHKLQSIYFQVIVLYVCACVYCYIGASPSKLPTREEGFPAFYRWLATHRAEFDKARDNVPLSGGEVREVFMCASVGRWI